MANLPTALVFGHGLWNDLSLPVTLQWLDTLLNISDALLPLESPKLFKLFVTPTAAGPAKPDEWLVSQGNKALQLFEWGVEQAMADRDVEHLGTWNMSIQARKYDGVHLDLKGNLVKAMMVLNWLNTLNMR